MGTNACATEGNATILTDRHIGALVEVHER